MTRKIKSVYLSAIHQNAGKTTMSLALFKLFTEKKLRTAFMKPVGQDFVKVKNERVDKDSYLIKEVFRCHKNLKDMSPVTVGRGFTQKYIFHPVKDQLKRKILLSFEKMKRGKDILIIEGTGHAGVGSVFDFSNADVANILNSKVIIISEGGIGKSIDEIALNKALFDLKGVEILGVIINKVYPSKYKKLKKFLTRGLKNKGIRVLGIIPQDPILSSPTVEQVMEKLNLKLLCGGKNLDTHVENTIIAAMEPHNMMNYLKHNTLVVTSGDRVDNILVSVSTHVVGQKGESQVAGIILTGGLTPDEQIIHLLKTSEIPVMFAKEDTYTVAGKLETLICKIEKNHHDKILEATKIVRQNVDIDAILKNL